MEDVPELPEGKKGKSLFVSGTMTKARNFEELILLQPELAGGFWSESSENKQKNYPRTQIIGGFFWILLPYQSNADTTDRLFQSSSLHSDNFGLADQI